MTGESDTFAERRRKLAALRARGEAYPNTFRRRDSAAALGAAHGGKDRSALEAANETATVAGRIMLRRVMGKAGFVTLADPSGRIQCYLRASEVGADAYRDFATLWDLGDIVGVRGALMRTRTGELTVRAEQAELLAKALRPLPDKHRGLADRQLRYRHRHLDLIVHEDVRRRFAVRARVVRELRRFFDERGFLEVETPMMHPIPGGAAARPFTTHHNSLDMALYLRVAPELYLKRLLVGGLERVYELNRCFRNEGLSPRHNPEFTTIEFYQAFADYQDLMDLTETLLKHLLDALDLGEVITVDGQRIDFGVPIPRRSMTAVVAAAVGADEADVVDPDKLARIAERFGIQGSGWGALLMAVFEARAEGQLIQPTFVTGYPAEVSPLARRSRAAPALADRFELFVAGQEIANGFSELNDPEDQAERFRAQAALQRRGDMEAMRFDQDFITALEHGMPPAAGEGIGVDRLVMLLTDSPTIRDVVLFPQLRPQDPGRPPR